MMLGGGGEEGRSFSMRQAKGKKIKVREGQGGSFLSCRAMVMMIEENCCCLDGLKSNELVPDMMP